MPQAEPLVHPRHLTLLRTRCFAGQNRALCNLRVLTLDFELHVTLANLRRKTLHLCNVRIVQITFLQFSGFFDVLALVDVLGPQCLQILDG